MSYVNTFHCNCSPFHVYYKDLDVILPPLKHIALRILLSLTLCFGLFSLATNSFAAAPSIGCGQEFTGDSGILPGCENTNQDTAEQGRNIINSTIPSIINWSIGLLGLVAMAFLVKGGFTFITSLGVEAKMHSAVKTITAALVGLFLVTVSYIIVTVATNFSLFS